MRAKAIGTRVTLGGAFVSLVVCGVLCVVLYTGLWLSLRREVDLFLSSELDELARVAQDDPDEESLQRFVRYEVGVQGAEPLALQIFDEGGQLVVTTETGSGVALLPPPRTGTRRARPQTVSAPVTKLPTRVCSQTVAVGDRIVFIQASYALGTMQRSLATFRWVCAGGLGLATLLSVVMGRLLAITTLRPIRNVIEKAESIGVNALGERIPRPESGDEVDRLVATLNEMLERIERYVRQTERFTADAAHELRSPVAALRGRAEVALSTPRTVEQLCGVLADCVEQCDRLSRIADDLLLLARADSAAEIISPQPTRLDALVADIVDLYAPVAEDAGVRLSFNACGDQRINADAGRLRQLASNLIDNAIRHTPEGGHVDVSLARENGSVALRVADTGRGIPAKHLPHIFDRFYRADAARSAGGAGLGLAISETIARAHRGRIDVESHAKRGSVFTVTLPTREAT